ncbi:glycosyl hydrolase family 61-domain-containing protein [Paraphoma chrysanthemicola]|uniref:Glycosyl hydrolase family 61-domain-containing protein n=1 Tax=Paraphoma chrysanthemicola TaxID=798071 RepID=A0A8K0RH91_9PLEO|nr:glycosyl hydrolase family 61-domain-containing protein [Paraphoma chrysanthemicola]
MYKSITSLSAIAALAATATAHGTTTGVTIDGVFTGGFKLDYYYAKQNNGPIPEHIGWYAENLDNGFVEPNAFGTADIICHKAASPEGSSDSLAKVAAGGTVEFHWSAWPESHMGPVITYVAPYTGDIASVDKTTLKWAKIQEDGYADGAWAAVKMIKQNNTWPVTVPSTLAAGKYVFRHEIIALHGAGSANGAQNYPQCLNIEVTGSGTAVPEGVVGTELYTVQEEGIIFNPYAATIDYPIPGPKLWNGAGSGSSPTTPTTPTTPSNGTASAAPSASAPAASATPVEEEDTPVPSASAVATPVATPAPSAGAGGSSGDLPAEFTLETFIAWLEGKAAGSSSKARRHARSFF